MQAHLHLLSYLIPARDSGRVPAPRSPHLSPDLARVQHTRSIAAHSTHARPQPTLKQPMPPKKAGAGAGAPKPKGAADLDRRKDELVAVVLADSFAQVCVCVCVCVCACACVL
jgi:hypothetical protein